MSDLSKAQPRAQKVAAGKAGAKKSIEVRRAAMLAKWGPDEYERRVKQYARQAKWKKNKGA